jgi:hypothetical protein
MATTITPCTVIEIAGELDAEEHTSTLAFATFVYDQFSIGDNSLDLATLTARLSADGQVATHDLRGYGPCIIRIKN